MKRITRQMRKKWTNIDERFYYWIGMSPKGKLVYNVYFCSDFIFCTRKIKSVKRKIRIYKANIIQAEMVEVI